MSRALNAVLMLSFILLCVACEALPLAPLEPDPHHYRVEMSYVDRATVVTEDTSPVWDLGRHAVKEGDDRVIVVTRHTSTDEVDADGFVVAGQHRDVSVERLLVTFPADARWGRWLNAEDLELDFLTGYEVDRLDGRGYLKQGHGVKGFLNPLEETDAGLVVVFDLEILSWRPGEAARWAIRGRHTLPKVEAARVAVDRKQR